MIPPQFSVLMLPVYVPRDVELVTALCDSMAKHYDMITAKLSVMEDYYMYIRWQVERP